MRFNSVATALGVAMLAGKAYAEDAQDESSAASSSSSVAPELPTFTVCCRPPRYLLNASFLFAIVSLANWFS